MEGPNKLWGGEENISKLMNERGTFIRNLRVVKNSWFAADGLSRLFQLDPYLRGFFVGSCSWLLISRFLNLYLEGT